MHEWLKQKALDISFPPDGYGVYVIWPENNRFIKIGLTREVRNRLADLQHAHGEEVRLLCWFECSDIRDASTTEYRLHSCFWRHRGKGEHFLVAPDSVTDFLNTFGGVKYLSSRDAHRFVDACSQADQDMQKAKDDAQKRHHMEIVHVAETISPKLKEKFLRQRLSDTSCHMKGSDNY